MMKDSLMENKKLSFQEQKRAYFKAINHQRTMFKIAVIVITVLLLVFATVMNMIFKL